MLTILFLVKACAFVITDQDALHPFDRPGTDDAWNVYSQGASVLDGQILTVHLVCEEHGNLGVSFAQDVTGQRPMSCVCAVPPYKAIESGMDAPKNLSSSHF